MLTRPPVPPSLQVSNVEVYYRAIVFYLEEHPELLLDLMKVLELRVDHTRVVDIFRKRGHLPLIKDYLINVQKVNIAEVRSRCRPHVRRAPVLYGDALVDV